MIAPRYTGFPPTMNLKQLEAIIYVSRHGTFKQAAEALYFDSSGEEYITPESIQYRIKQLEAELGVSLYRKRQGSSRVTLTREGQLFLTEALEVYQRMTEWKGMFLDSEQGMLTFASTQAVIMHRLTPAITEFRQKYPAMRLRVINAYAQLAEDLVAQGRVDFGFSTRPPEQSELEYVVWKRSNMVLITPPGHPLSRKEKVTLAEISEFEMVLLEPEIRGDRETVDEAFRRANLKRPKVIMETSNSEVICSWVEAGLGISVIAETSLLRQPRKLATVPIADQIGRSEVGLLVREGQYLAARTRDFLMLLDPAFEKWLKDRDERLQAVATRSLASVGGSGDVAPSNNSGKKSAAKTRKSK